MHCVFVLLVFKSQVTFLVSLYCISLLYLILLNFYGAHLCPVPRTFLAFLGKPGTTEMQLAIGVQRYHNARLGFV